MIKVLYVSEALTRNSGVTTVILNLVKNIISKDIQIDLLTYRGGDSEIIEMLEKYGVTVYFIPELGLSTYYKFKKHVSIFFEKNKYDIVHSHFNQIDSIIFKIAQKNGVNTCISHSHNTKLSDSKIKSFRNRLLCYSLPKRATVWAACSADAGVCLYGKKFLGNNKSFIIRNGIDCSKFKYNEVSRKTIRDEFKIKDDEVLIGTVGGFRKQKNHSFLIDVFNELNSKNKKYKLLLVGDGELKTDIMKKVENLKLNDSVYFAGTRKDINKIMSAIDLFILTSLYEGLPLVGVEAQASGLPCVFSKTITKDLDLTEVLYIDLDVSPGGWASEIESMDISRRKNNDEIIRKKGFDIAEECKNVEVMYRRCITERN